MKIALGLILLILLVLVLRAGELYTQLARYQRYWDRINQRPAGRDELTYVAFGDSAAQGVGASRPQKGYVGLIAADLSRQTARPVRVINLSKSGARINDVLKTQLPRYEALRISGRPIVTIEIGANDILRFDHSRFYGEMDELMARLPKNTVMSDLPSFKGSRLAKYDPVVVEANGIIRELARKHGISPVALYERTARNHGPRTFGGDFFHPSDYGYKTNWLPVFMERIRSNTL